MPTRAAEHPARGSEKLYARLDAGPALSLSDALSVVDGWTVARFFGGVSTTSGYSDPGLRRSLRFIFLNCVYYLITSNGVAAGRRDRALCDGARWQLKRDSRTLAAARIDLRDLRGPGTRIDSSRRWCGVPHRSGAEFWSGASTIFFPTTATDVRRHYVQQDTSWDQCGKGFGVLAAPGGAKSWHCVRAC